MDPITFRQKLVEVVFAKKFVVHLAFVGLLLLAGHSGQLAMAAPRSSLLYNLITGEEVVEGPLDPSAYAQVEGPGLGGARLAAVQATESAIGDDPIGADSIEAQVIPETLGGNAVVAPLTSLVAEPGSDVPARQPVAKPHIYTIQDGDTLASIAAQAGISVNTILWANSLTERDTLKVGHHLVVPPATGVLHTVHSGDTLLAIANTYDAKVSEITDYNHIASDATLRIGQQIMIPDGAIPEQRAPQIVSRGTRLAGVEVDNEPTPLPQPKSSGTLFQQPVTNWTITQQFRSGHTGVDFARADRTDIPTVYAAADGAVEYAGWLGGYGNLIVLNHGNGWRTYYGHMSRFFARQGQQIERGQALGKEGSTGHSSGVHLHFETRYNGQPSDPCRVLSSC